MSVTKRDLDEPAGSDLFLKLGGNAVLDLCNTVLDHAAGHEDRLNSRECAERFLKEFFEVNDRLSEAGYSSLLDLRGNLRAFFHSLAERKNGGKELEALNQWLRSRPIQLQVERLSAHQVRSRAHEVSTEGAYLTRVIQNFIEFIDQSDLDRLRKCANPDCSHLFYDSSKGGKRAWCSMSGCGNLMKARAFHQRARKKRKETK